MFKKATKAQIKIRLAISGPSGSGKTYTSLAIATALGKRVAVIDTEHGSASRYADLFDFEVCELDNHHPAKYIEAIQAAERMGFDVIIADSFSHAWFAELELAGKGFDGWKNVRPLERKLIEKIVSSPAHIIATMRSKTEYVMEEYVKDGRTKNAPKKVGMAPIQSSGIEYEFDIAGELDHNHIMSISKSRCPALTDQTFLNPGKNIADELLRWINSAPPEQPTVPTYAPAVVAQQPTIPEQRVIPINSVAQRSQTPETWASWKTPGDAINWACKILYDWPVEEVQLEFDKLQVPPGGKKAAKWVERVNQLAEEQQNEEGQRLAAEMY